ncbi:MAG: glycosyltransferase family 4 protein [Pirellulales bacterium]|nr:glycosyltransferase family 4 protein [Pirellulales bacterium]
MRIAHVITRLIVGGAQENTILNCQDLMELHGDQVLLITGPGLGPEGDLVPAARRRKIPLVILPSMRRAIHPWRDWQSYRGIVRALADFQPDVVHTHSGKAGLLGRWAAYRLGIPAIVHTVHGAPFHNYQGRAARALLRKCERMAARRCHAIISVANAMTDQMVAAGIAEREKFMTVYSGMEIESFLNAGIHRDRIRAELGYRPEEIVVAKIGRLFFLKGHADVIRAAEKAVLRAPQLRFLLVGDGILRPRLQRQADDAGLDRLVHFTGLVPPDRIAEYLAAADIVVHASYREGLARVLPQALLTGRPVVSYDVDGAREVVEDHVTGYLVPPGNVALLADRFVQLAEDADLRHRLGEAGRQRCIEPFRHDTMTGLIRSLYQSLLEKYHA